MEKEFDIESAGLSLSVCSFACFHFDRRIRPARSVIHISNCVTDDDRWILPRSSGHLPGLLRIVLELAVVLYLSWEMVRALVNFFRIAIADFDNEYESIFDHSSSESGRADTR